MPSSSSNDVIVVWSEWPHARIWQRLETYLGDVTEFAVQLEYNHQELPGRVIPPIEPEWKPVARLDHSHRDHDWRHEPPHVDIYREGRKYEVYDDFGMVDPNEGIDFSLKILYENKAELLSQYERVHDLNGPFALSPTRR